MHESEKRKVKTEKSATALQVPLMEIERFSINDGPGIRTVVFLKGCPLHCPWCANPESQSPEPQQMRKDGELVWVGRPMDINEVMTVLECDADYYANSGGGITLSGGECMMHGEVLLQLLQACKQRGWHTAIETSGMAPTKTFQAVLPYVDLFLFDLKHTDAQKLKAVTGADLALILKNLRTILHSSLFTFNSSLTFRIPCIPDFNVTPDFFTSALALAKELGIHNIDLLPYHTLGMEKYRQLGRNYPYPITQPLDKRYLVPYQQQGQALGLDIHIVV